MKNSILFFILFVLAGFTMAQEVVFEQVYDDTIIPTHGANLKHFGHLYMGFGFPIIDESKEAEIRKGLSMSFEFGYRYKRKICEYWAVGYDLSYSLQGYRMKDDQLGLTNYKKRSYLIQNLNLGIYQRINFNRRGNSIGKYLDLGGYGAWNFGKNHVYSRKGTGDETFNWIEINERGIDYIERWQYGLEARLGTNRYSLFGRYRLSDIIKKQNVMNLGELPRLSIGLQLGFF